MISCTPEWISPRRSPALLPVIGATICWLAPGRTATYLTNSQPIEMKQYITGALEQLEIQIPTIYLVKKLFF